MVARNSDTLQVGMTIRSLRQARKLSQEDLGDLADLDRTYVGGIERGERNPSLLNLIKLAMALEVRRCELLQGLP